MSGINPEDYFKAHLQDEGVWSAEEEAAFHERNPDIPMPEWDYEDDFKPYKSKANGHARPGVIRPLVGIDAADLKGNQKPREFLDHAEIFPCRNVALVMGDGAIGKSLLMLQLAVACASGTQWASVDVKSCPVVYFSAEDDRDELTNRLNEICDEDGIDLETVRGRLTILDMVGQDTVLGGLKEGRIHATPVYQSLLATLELHKPGLLILDNNADVFAGNENDRTHAKQFINLLRALCLRFGLVVILIGHPSVSGKASGEGTSGSTGWNNSVRVRPYFYKPDGTDADDDDRIFEVKKANYSKAGSVRWELKWKKGRFVRGNIKSVFDRISIEDLERVQAKFSGGNWRVHEQSQDWGGYAVADLLGWDVGRGIASGERTKEQATNRANIRTYLGTWVQSKAIYVVEGFTPKREKTQFYSNSSGPA